MKSITLLFFALVANTLLLAKESPFSISFGLCQGIPLTHKTESKDNFLQDYKSVFAFDIAGRYKLKRNWEFGLYFNFNALYIDRGKAATSIIKTQASQGYLYKASGKGNVQTQALGLEVSKVFKFNKWSLAPFLRSSFYYSNHGSFKLSLKEKVEHEHYYKQTDWTSSDSESYDHFSPLMLSGGLRLFYQWSPNSALYFATQYQSGSAGFGAIKEKTDFYDSKKEERVNFKQNYSFIGFELGYKYTFSKARKNRSNFDKEQDTKDDQ